MEEPSASGPRAFWRHHRPVLLAALAVFALAAAIRLGHLASLRQGLEGTHIFATGRVDAAYHLREAGEILDGDPWLVGIRSPGAPDDVIATVGVEDEAVATSGDYEQGFDHAGRRYHHIFDGPTGEPRRTASRTLTVRAATCIDADAAATAAFGQEPSTAQAFLDRGVPGARVVHLA